MEIENCPFCGRNAKLSYGLDVNCVYGAESYVFVMCDSCGIRTPKFYYGSQPGERSKAEKMVIQRWNRRADNGSNSNL